MLVLSRKIGEKIIIGNDIVITILSNNENNIKIGVDAPNNIPIYRYEVYEKIKNFIKEASKSSSDFPEISDIKSKINKYPKK
ncbi:MAG: carbon storage regulator CsrA [Candidatus Anstonellales archaeon]|jgi:carbon storage regulator|nr:carbon storage regulator CsrA [Ignavibacteriales bacterium]